MYAELLAGAWLIGEYVYNKLTATDPPLHPATQLTIPSSSGGDPIPLIYGRCRVKSPVLAWIGTPKFYDTADLATVPPPEKTGVVVYAANAMMVIGIPVNSGSGKIYSMWAGDAKLVELASLPPASIFNPSLDKLVLLNQLEGAGGAAYSGDTYHIGESSVRQAGFVTNTWDYSGTSIRTGGMVEFLKGIPLVDYVNPAPAGALTQAGARMPVGGLGGTGTIPSPNSLPAYKPYLSAFLYGIGDVPWIVGLQPQFPALSFEVSSYPPFSFITLTNGTIQVGQWDMNPVDVIYDLVTTYFGKMGYTTAKIDTAGWESAANTLWTEGNGYSRAIEDGQTAGDILLEIMKQVDGVVYEMPDGTLKIRLIRADFDPAALFNINTDNCADLEDLAFGSWQDIPTRIILKFRNRNKDYNEDSVTVQNLANAAGLDNQIVEIQLDYPGICDPENALNVATRELQVRSKPLAKCRAIMDRSAYRLEPGEPVMVNFPKYNVANMVFRVAKVPTGTLLDGKMAFELVQDPYYVWRNRVRPHPSPVIVNSNVGNTVSGKLGF